MRFVTPKNEAQQVLSALHRVRESLIRERTKASNQIHGFLLEFGISLPIGRAALRRLPAILAEQSLPPRLVQVLDRLQVHFKYLDEQIADIDKNVRRLLVQCARAYMNRLRYQSGQLARWPTSWPGSPGPSRLAIPSLK